MNNAETTMNDEAAKTTLKDRLKNKPILFVDDLKTTVGNYIGRLNDSGFKCELANSLDDALKRIENEDFGLVVLDLFMEPARSRQLIKFQNTVKITPTSRNQGRTLGQYLWEQRNIRPLPYCYFTVYPKFYGEPKGEFGDNFEPFLLDKATILPSHFVEKLVEALRQWDAFLAPPAPDGEIQ
jgi:hypothetical protein